MFKRFFCGLLLYSLTLSGGCLFPSYRQVREFDLDVEPVAGSGRIHVAVMRNYSCSSTRIQYRKGFELERDPYNLWVREPGNLVCSALNRALGRDGSSPQITMRGEIECFEADVQHRIFRLSGYFHRVPDGRKIRFDIKAPLRGNSAENIVLAASEAVRQLAVRMAAHGK